MESCDDTRAAGFAELQVAKMKGREAGQTPVLALQIEIRRSGDHVSE